MDLINLGTEGRKSKIRPREGVRRDEYNMEDVDEFFADDEEATARPAAATSAAARSAATSAASRRDFNNVARKIDFTEAAAEQFTLSPVSFQAGAKPPPPRKSRKSPLRSPLPERPLDRYEDAVAEEDLDFDDDFEVDTRLSPIAVDGVEVASPRGSPRGSSRGSPRGTPRASALTRTMALGQPRRRRPPTIYASQEAPEETPRVSPRPSRPPRVSSRPLPAARSPESLSPPTKLNYTKSRVARPRVTKPSPLPSPPPDGLRRSKRTKIAPLAFWRNERIVYSKANDDDDDADTTLARDIRKIPLQQIKEVVHIPETGGAAAKRRARSKSRQPSGSRSNSHGAAGSAVGSGGSARGSVGGGAEYDYESDPEIEGSEWYANQSLVLPVYVDGDSSTKRPRTVAWAPNSGRYQRPPRDAASAAVREDFRVATLFDEDKDYTACGMLELPFEGVKSLRHTDEHVFMFHVVRGLVEVTINDATFVVTRGCSFEVPRANMYGLKNLGRGAATLFFVQTRVGHPAEGDSEGSWD
ncbi:Mif2/CENP-C cupin domain-containing protein [[Candida] zeylanoides]